MFRTAPEPPVWVAQPRFGTRASDDPGLSCVVLAKAGCRRSGTRPFSLRSPVGCSLIEGSNIEQENQCVGGRDLDRRGTTLGQARPVGRSLNSPIYLGV